MQLLEEDLVLGRLAFNQGLGEGEGLEGTEGHGCG